MAFALKSSYWELPPPPWDILLSPLVVCNRCHWGVFPRGFGPKKSPPDPQGKGGQVGGSGIWVVKVWWTITRGEWVVLRDQYHAAHIIWLSAGGEARQGEVQWGGKCVGGQLGCNLIVAEFDCHQDLDLSLGSCFAEPLGPECAGLGSSCGLLGLVDKTQGEGRGVVEGRSRGDWFVETNEEVCVSSTVV